MRNIWNFKAGQQRGAAPTANLWHCHMSGRSSSLKTHPERRWGTRPLLNPPRANAQNDITHTPHMLCARIALKCWNFHALNKLKEQEWATCNCNCHCHSHCEGEDEGVPQPLPLPLHVNSNFCHICQQNFQSRRLCDKMSTRCCLWCGNLDFVKAVASTLSTWQIFQPDTRHPPKPQNAKFLSVPISGWLGSFKLNGCRVEGFLVASCGCLLDFIIVLINACSYMWGLGQDVPGHHLANYVGKQTARHYPCQSPSLPDSDSNSILLTPSQWAGNVCVRLKGDYKRNWPKT